MAIRGFMGAINRPEPVLWITLAAIPANALLVYLLLIMARSACRSSACSARGLRPRSSMLGTFLAGAVVRRVSPAVPEISRARRISGASTGR